MVVTDERSNKRTDGQPENIMTSSTLLGGNGVKTIVYSCYRQQIKNREMKS